MLADRLGRWPQISSLPPHAVVVGTEDAGEGLVLLAVTPGHSLQVRPPVHCPFYGLMSPRPLPFVPGDDRLCVSLRICIRAKRQVMPREAPGPD